MNIFDKIVASKRTEVTQRKELFPLKLLEKSVFFGGPCVSLKRYLEREDLHGIIAEIKRASPSAGEINPFISVEKLSIGYMQAGASALSILTDTPFFKGSLEDLKSARTFNFCPILRKDFIIDEYQIVEAKSYGADVILLIAACLTPEECKRLAQFSRSLTLEVLLEVHNQEELRQFTNEYITCVGVNNRDLKTLTIDVQTSMNLIKEIPSEFIPITESGIATPETFVALKTAGYKGFLIGESFMKTSNPAYALQQFVYGIQQCLSR